jgi:hypothetical protein
MPRINFGRWFGERADKIISSLWSASFDAITSDIDELASEAARRSKKSELTEYFRTIADLRILAARKKMRPLAECEAAYTGRMQLGFSTVADEVIATGAHARHCRRLGEQELAQNYAKKALARIEGTRQSADPPVPAEVEATLQELAGDGQR